MTSSFELRWLGKQKIILKGAAVTSIIILLMLPSLFIFRLSSATIYPEAAAPIGLSPPTLVTLTSSPTSELRVGEQFMIITPATNREKFDVPLVIVTQVADSEGVIVSIGIVGGIVKVGESTRVGVSWAPPQSGNYHLKSFAISELEHPMIFARPSESDVTVFASPQTPQNTTMPKLKVTELKTDVGPSGPGIPILLISVKVTDIPGNPVGGAMVSATVTNSSGYWKTFSGQTNSTGAWNFLWQLSAKSKLVDYSETLNIRVNASKYGYEDGSVEINVPIAP